MPSQGATLVKVAAVPGAINLDADTLRETDILSVSNGGPTSAQATIAVLAERLGILPLGYHSRVVTENSEAVVDTDDVALLVDKTVSSATSFLLPDPILRENDDGTFLGRVLIFTDMKGDAQNYPITLDAGTGNTINGSQTLVLDQNFASVTLIGESDTQWGILAGTAGGGAEGRTKLIANTNFFVAPPPTGNDANSGLVGFPKATHQAVIDDLKRNYDLGGYLPTINTADGDYSTQIRIEGSFVGEGEFPSLVIVGNLANPENVRLTVVGNAVILRGTGLDLGGMKISTTVGSFGQGLSINDLSLLTYHHIWLSDCDHEQLQVALGSGAVLTGPLTVDGVAEAFCHFTDNSFATYENPTITLLTSATAPNGPMYLNYIFGGNRSTASLARATLVGTFGADGGHASRLTLHIGAILNVSQTINIEALFPDGSPAPQIDTGGSIAYEPGVGDTIYCRLDAVGNNADGYADNATRAFLLPSSAFTALAERPPDQAFSLVPVVQIGPGTWTSITPPDIPGVAVAILRGDPDNPSNCKISTTGANCIEPTATQTLWILDGFELSSTGASGISGLPQSKIQFMNIIFGVMGGANQAHIVQTLGSFIESIGPYTVNGNAGSFIRSGGGQLIITDEGTFNGTLTYSVATVYGRRACRVRWDGVKTIVGTVSGPRVDLDDQALVEQNTEIIPGSTAGTVNAANFALLV